MSDTETDKQSNQEILNDQPRYYAELIDQIISELESFFATRLDDMFKQADDHLFEAADEASSTAEQNSLFECMNAIRANRQAIQQNFVDELSVYLQPVGELEELPQKKQTKKPEALGLVEQNEMDEMVKLTSISSKASMDNAEAINHLIKRLKELAQYNDHIFHGEALEPKRLCDAIHEAVAKTDLIDSNRLVVYRFFEKALVSDLAKLYETLNNMLIEQGILPEIDYSGAIPHYEAEPEMPVEADAAPENGQAPPPAAGASPRLPPGASAVPPGMRRPFGSGMAGYASYSPAAAPAPMAGAPAGGVPAGAPMAPPTAGGGYAPANGGAPVAGGAPAAGGGAPVAAGGRRAFGSGISGFASAPPVQPPVADPAGGAGGPEGAAPSAGPAPSGYTAGRPVEQVREAIEGFVGGSSSSASAGGEGYYSHSQVMTALTELQVAAENISETPLVFDANQIKQAVLATIGESEGGAVTKAVNQVSEKTIDFIKLIFDAIIDEESITDEIKTLLLSLQIPVIKAAMIDSDFFVDDQHPARQLLDKIAEAGVGVTEHTDPVYIEIEKVVRKLLNDYDEDVIAFTVALRELEELTEEIYRKARETEAESQKAVKMAHAKRIVLQEIRKITIGKELPQGIRTLVLKVWPSMMFNHFLKKGKANDEWVELLMILQKIIESVQPISTIEELRELGLSHQDIVDAARNTLKKCRKRKELVDQVLRELEQTYESLINDSNVTEESTPPDTEESVAADARPEPEAETETDQAAEETGAEELSLDQAEAQAEPEPEPEEDSDAIARAKIAKLPEGVTPGAWFIVYNGEDKPVRRLKLAVILIHDATIVFVDHLGNVVIEKDAEVFANEIEKGLSGMIMQHSVFDHALSSALETIER